MGLEFIRTFPSRHIYFAEWHIDAVLPSAIRAVPKDIPKTANIMSFEISGWRRSEIHPFWAVVHQKAPKSVYNMKLEEFSFDVHHPHVKSFPQNPVLTAVTLPVFWNVSALVAGDVLTVEFQQ